jgi:predicted nucleic acid-binding protein
MYLLDTNIISEARKGAGANRGVLDFFHATRSSDHYLPVQTIGEIRRGIENVRGHGDAGKAMQLEQWLDRLLGDFANRIVGFDADCAQVWGRLMSPNAANPVDKQIAAIALLHGLVVVTRNAQDFHATGVKMLNPFTTP